MYILYTFSKELKLCEIMIILKIFLSTGYPVYPSQTFSWFFSLLHHKHSTPQVSDLIFTI